MYEMDLIEFLILFGGLVAVLTVLWKETVAFRWTQYSLVGVGAASATAVAVKAIWTNGIIPITNGNYILIIPMILGMLIIFQQFTRYVWIARYPLYLLMGVGTAIAIRGILVTDIISQITGIFALAKSDIFTGIFQAILVIITMIYFFFYFVHKVKAGRSVSKVGRYIIMFSLGVTFGTGIMYNFQVIAYIFLWIFKTGPPKTGPMEITVIAAILTALAIILGEEFIGRYLRVRAQPQ